MSELAVGSLAGLAANSYVIDVASGSSLDLSNGATLPAGSVLQVVSTTKTDTFSASVASGASTAITDLSVAITPTATTSKILVMTNLNLSGSHSPGIIAGFLIKRDATTVGNGVGSASRTALHSAFNGDTGSSGGAIAQLSGSFLDSPATTSAITYAIEIVNLDGATETMYVNRSRLDNDDVTRARGASTITVMEIAG